MDGITRRELLRRAGLGFGALTLGRYLEGGPAWASATGGAAPLQIARVRVRDAARAALLAGFDDTHARPPDGTAELLLWPGDARRLEALGFDYTIVVDDVVARDAVLLASAPPAAPAGVPGARTDYRRYAEFEADIRSLVDRFPDRARLLELPQPSLEGRKVYGIEIATNVGARDGRPVFYIDGVHHAREWPAAELPIMLAFDLLESYGTDGQVTSIVDSVRSIIVPVVNADGFHHSRESLVQQSLLGGVAGGQEGYWRKNRRSFTGATVPVVQKNPDAYGVDPNRNYGYEWGDDEGGSSSSQFDQTTRGPEPFSEPETRNVRGLILSRQVITLITNHTYGRLILRPWGHTDADPPDEAILKFLGAEMARFNRYTSQKGIGLYATTGTTDDWAYAAVGTLGYTYEHGSSFHPAYTTAIPGMYTSNRGAFLLLAQAAANTAYHSLMRGRAVSASGPVAAEIRVTKSFRTPLWRGGDGSNPTGQTHIDETLDSSMVAAPDGSFVYHLNPSTRPIVTGGRKEAYTVTVSADGAGSRIFEVVLDRGQVLDLGDVVLG